MAQHPTPPLDEETEDALRAREFQPDSRMAAGNSSEALTGSNGDDNSGSGGTAGGHEIKGKNVATSTQYDKPGNADEGDVGGSTTSSGSASGSAGTGIGQVNL